MYTRQQIEAAVKAKKYAWFADEANKGYDVNIVGVRNNAPSVADKVTNVFDDHITISYKDENGVEQFFCWSATTDPGKKGVQQFSNKKGVARLFHIELDKNLKLEDLKTIQNGFKKY